MALDIEIVTAPGADAALDIVTTAEMRKHLRLTATSLDEVIETAIRSAVAYFDGINGILNRSVLPYEWKMYRSCFPDGRVIRLPFPPLVTVSSVTYNDSDGDEQTLSSSAYVVRKHPTMPSEIELVGSDDWPETETYQPRAVAITFFAGYGLAGGSPDIIYPEELKRAVKFLAAHYVRNPEVMTADPRANRQLAFGLDSLIATLRVPFEYGEWE